MLDGIMFLINMVSLLVFKKEIYSFFNGEYFKDGLITNHYDWSHMSFQSVFRNAQFDSS